MSAETIVRDIFGDSDDSEDEFEVWFGFYWNKNHFSIFFKGFEGNKTTQKDESDIEKESQSDQIEANDDEEGDNDGDNEAIDENKSQKSDDDDKDDNDDTPHDETNQDNREVVPDVSSDDESIDGDRRPKG